MNDLQPTDQLAGRRILVTGATGFIGAHLIRALAGRGLRCRGLVRATSRREILAPWSEHVELVTGDARDLDSLVRACEGIDLCLNAAGTNDMSLTQAAMHEIIVPTTRNLMEACRRQGVRKVVTISSCETLGVTHSAERQLDERAPYDPANDHLLFAVPYHQAEEIVAQYVAGGLDVSMVNLLYVMSPGDPGQLFDGILGMGRIAVAMGGGFSLSLIDDVVAMLLAAATRGAPGARYMVAGENVTYVDFTRRLRRAGGRKGIVVRIPDWLAWTLIRLPFVPTQARELLRYSGKYLYYDCSRARNELGYQMPSLDQVIDSVLHGTPRFALSAHRKS